MPYDTDNRSGITKNASESQKGGRVKITFDPASLGIDYTLLLVNLQFNNKSYNQPKTTEQKHTRTVHSTHYFIGTIHKVREIIVNGKGNQHADSKPHKQTTELQCRRRELRDICRKIDFPAQDLGGKSIPNLVNDYQAFLFTHKEFKQPVNT